MEIEWAWRCWWGTATSWQHAAYMQEQADRDWLIGAAQKAGVTQGEILWSPCWPPQAMPWYPSDFPDPMPWTSWEKGCNGTDNTEKP